MINLQDERSLNIVSIDHKPYMFTNMRIKRDSIPDRFYAYDVRDDDDCSGSFAQIKRFVVVNHWGTCIGLDEIPLDPEYGDYYPEDIYYTGDYVESAEEFEERYEELLDECLE